MTPRPQPNAGKGPSNANTPGKARVVKPGPTPAELLAKVPRRPMTPDQQAAALEKVQQQATQRVQLGKQLFDAAEQRLKQHQQVLKEIQEQQRRLREQVQEDVAKSLQSYDQWLGKIDENFTGAISDLNHRLDTLESRFDGSRGEMESMIAKAAELLDQTQGLLADAFGDGAAQMGSKPVEPIDEPVGTIEIHEVDEADEHAVLNGDIEPLVMPTDEQDPEADPVDDIFVDVLRRLKAQVEDEHRDDGGNAAA